LSKCIANISLKIKYPVLTHGGFSHKNFDPREVNSHEASRAYAHGFPVLILWLLQAYRYLISPWLGNHCRFYPSCSVYAQDAVNHYGVIKGLRLTLWRLLRCHPFHPGGYDPAVPDDPIKFTKID
jgi:uncharacterized protein